MLDSGHAERLIAAGAMRPAGQVAVDAAKAAAFYRTLNKSNLYAIAYRLHTAKRPQTRDQRQRDIIALLARGAKLH